ncbi:Putative dehydrogenase (3-hydroxybutyryl-CoA dehydrogenase FadB?) [Mycobacteroides abscessus subsp. abscessus]|nr:Putative dehydrogenase (3-hydroxybutyryl-CoA dehydrogenase FadB?) [Mycobacteroides abscessus subsp. abscessus]
MTYSPPADIDNRPVAVLGAGTLGRRIALTFATRGGVVHLYDVSEESLQSAKEFAPPWALNPRPSSTTPTCPAQ